MEITHCRLNHLENPLGYRLAHTAFSWQVEGSRGSRAAASRLVVAADPAMKKIVQDTGFAQLDSLATVLSLPLAPRTRYYWTVSVRTDAGEEATSPVQWFETAKQEEPWAGQWITCRDGEERHPIFCKELPAGLRVKQARLYLCGLGLYEAYLDGCRVGDEYLAPGCNDYNSWLQYQTYDVTEAIAAGARRLEILLGNGWYCGRYGLAMRSQAKPFFSDRKKLIAELRLRTEDGTELVIPTDESWTVRRSRITASGIYDGEVVDSTLPELEPEQAQLCTESMAPLTARLSPPVRVHERLPVQAVLHTPAGETALDIGQNQAGIFRLQVHGVPAGQQVRLQFGEVLQDGNFYRGNLGSARAEYIWTSDGQDACLQPHFTFYGYRYVKVEGLPDLRPEDFTALALYSDVEPVGSLSTGHPLLNRLISNVQWGQKSNFIDIPTDCPQRDERMGWTGDAQVFCPTASYFTDAAAFYRKYLHDLAQEQKRLDGMVPNVVPSVGESQDCSAAWGDAACILPWTLYQFTGDLTILEEQYPSMTAWVEYIARTDGERHGWRSHFHFGDWLALDHPAHRPDTMEGATDKGLIADTFYRQSLLLTAQTAQLLGKTADAARYQEMAERVLQGIRQEYFSPAGRCCVDTQTAHLLTLQQGLWPRPERAVQALKQSLAAVGNQLRTGFVGTPLLCPTLSQWGMDELAWDMLLNEDYPGWLHEVKLGATTVWERWNSLDDQGRISSTGMNSLNHYSYGSVLEWVWRYAAGLQPLAPGFRRAWIAPRPDRRIGHLSASYVAAAGRYDIAWQVEEERMFTLHLTVPFGCEAEVFLPFAPEDLYTVRDNPLFAQVEDTAQGKVCHLPAGQYEVAYRALRPLGKVCHTDALLIDLQHNPVAAACLEHYSPQAMKAHGWNKFRPLSDWMTEQGIQPPAGLAEALAQIPRN